MNAVYVPEKKRKIVECAARIMRQHKDPSEENANRVRELLSELQLTEQEVVEAAADLVII